MKKYKKLITSILAFILAITALPGSAPVYAADQVYVDDADLAGTVIKVADNGAELVHLNERIMTAGSETVYCIDINMDFESGYKTKHDAATEMSQEQITDIALCLEYIRQYAASNPLSREQKYLLEQCILWRRLSTYLGWNCSNTHAGYEIIPQNVQDDVYAKAADFARKNAGKYRCYGYIYKGNGQDVGQFFAEPLPGKGKLKKVSAVPAITDGNGCYSLSGAVYTVYSDRGCSQRVGTLTTDGSGNSGTIELNEGSYYVKETTAPKGYQLDTQIHTLNVTTGGTAVLNVQDQPKVTDTLLELLKIDMELKDGIPQGAASLAGARFEWKYYAGHYTKENLPANPTRTWVTQTKAEKDSAGKTHYVTALSDAYKVSRDAFYTQGGKAILPLGTITVEEKQAPQGYLLEDAYLQASGGSQKLTGLYVTQITESGNNAVLTGANRYSVSDKVIRGGVKIQKRDLETKAAEAQGNATLENTKYAVVSLNSNPVLVNGKSYTNGQTVLTLMADASGLASTGDNVLPFGHYKIEETDPPKGYLKDGAHAVEFDITEHKKIVDLTGDAVSMHNQVIRGGVKIQKRDLETKEAQPQGGASLEGTEFSITNLSAHPVFVNNQLYEKGQVVLTVKTDQTGAVSTANNALPYGHYKIEETKPPKGYLSTTMEPMEFDITENGKIMDLSPEETSFYNQVIRGGVNIQKRDLETKKPEAQGGATLEHAEFSITTLSEHPVVVDGKTYSKGQSVVTIKTDQNGLASTEKDTLPYGHYKVEEIKAPEGYLKDGAEVLEFDILENEKFVELTSEDSSIYNQVIRGDLEFVKISDGDMKRLSDVPFSITSKTTGESHTIVTDKNGYASTSSEWNKHTQNTNQGKTSEDGIWFGTVEPDDTKGALLYDTYTIEEQPCKANEGMDLLKFEASVYRDSVTVDLGTLTDDIIEIGTTALDKESNTHMSAPKEKVTIVDTVEYSGLKKGQEYKIVGTLMNAEDGSPILIDGKEVTSEKTFKAKKSDGKVEVTFTFDATSLVGKTTVVFETLYQEDLKLAVHADIEDTDQQVAFPEIGTTAADSDTGENIANADETVMLTDTIAYKGLIPDQEYTATGTLMDQETGKPILIHEKPITAQTAFTPDTIDGTVDVVFEFDGSELKGRKTVIFESVAYEEKEVAVHADLSEEKQQMFFPEIGTKASCPETGSQMALPKKDLTITDTVSYHLVPGKEYKLTGTLMDKETGEPLLIDEKPVTSELTFTPEEAEGTVELSFTFDASALQGKTLVAFESVSYQGKEIAVHTDIEDEPQTIYFPEIGTKASCPETESQTAPPKKDLTITDTVSYRLVPGKEYKLTGTLMDKKTGEALLVDGKTITAEQTFTPEKEEGSVELSFTFDASALAGKTVVAFESVSYEGKEIAVHADIESVPQSIYFSEIGTKAICPETGSQMAPPKKELTITVTVSYHLVPGKEYQLTGTLMDKETGKPLQMDGKPVTSELKFTPKEAEGSVELSFTFDASVLKGKTVVAFESVSQEGKEIAVHADINSPEQSIYFPEIGTTAKDGKDGDQEALAEKKTQIIDTVAFKGLMVGEYTYRLVGTLMDKETGKEVLVDGKPVTAETTFRLETAEGTLDVPFTFDATGLGGHDVVVFEKLFVTGKDGKEEKEAEVASHEDIEAKSQTIRLTEIPGTPEEPEDPRTPETPDVPKTGDTTNLWIPIVVLIAAFVGIVFVIIRIRRKRF